MTAPSAQGTDVLTLVLPLRAKEGLPLTDFYDYWLNAHVTLPPRFPGISGVWLHAVSFDGQTWPGLPGVSRRPEPEDEFHGVPEATFATADGLAAFQSASGLQMHDGINFLAEQIAYASLGDNSRTEVDRTGDPAPDGHDTWTRHLLFLRRRPEVAAAELQRFVAEDLAPALAMSPDVLKVRRHLFEPVELTLDHPGVQMWKPQDRQYQAMVEVVVPDDASLDRLVGSVAWTRVAGQLASRCQAVHAARVQRCITTKHAGQITVAGVRGVATADLIKRLGADNQKEPALSALFLPAAHSPDSATYQQPHEVRLDGQRDAPSCSAARAPAPAGSSSPHRSHDGDPMDTTTAMTSDQMVALMWDRQQITDVMLRFGRALDLHDWDMYAATLHNPFDVDFFDLTGQPPTTTTPELFARFASACLERLTVMHQYSNFHIDVQGDQATGVFYHVSRHRLPNNHGDDHYTQYGWYENSFTRTSDGWKISKLKHGFQWCDGNPGLIDATDPAWQEAAAAIFGR